MTSPSFWASYERLPQHVKDSADKSFDLLKQDTSHPSLHLKKVRAYYSARVGKGYRTLAVEVDGGLLWFWIGTHDRLVR